MLENEWDDAKHLLQITLSNLERILSRGHVHINCKTSQRHLALSKVFRHEGKLPEALQHAKMHGSRNATGCVWLHRNRDEITDALDLEQCLRLIEDMES